MKYSARPCWPLIVTCHCGHRQVRAGTGTLHPHKHLPGLGELSSQPALGSCTHCPWVWLIPRLSSSPHIQIPVWHWAGPPQAPASVQAQLSPVQPPEVSCSVGFSLLKRIWWIYSFFKRHKSQNHLFCIKNKPQECLQESSWIFSLKDVPSPEAGSPAILCPANSCTLALLLQIQFYSHMFTGLLALAWFLSNS